MVFAQNTIVFPQNTIVFSQNTTVFAQNATLFPQNTTVFVKSWNFVQLYFLLLKHGDTVGALNSENGNSNAQD